ncbi:hypothetical protein D9M73_135750 [compost metagenome]
MRGLADGDRGQPLIAADAVIGMDDEIARREHRQFGEERIGRFLALVAPHEAVAEHVLLGEQRDLRAAETVVEGEDDKGDRSAPPACGRGWGRDVCSFRGRWGGGRPSPSASRKREGSRRPQRFLPGIDQLEVGRAMIAQQSGQTLARTGRIARQHRLAPVACQPAQMVDDGFIDVRAIGALGTEIARAVYAEIDHGGAFRFVEGGDAVGGGLVKPLGKVLGGQIQAVDGERAIAARVARLRLHAVGVIIGDRFEALFCGCDRSGIAQDHRAVAQMIEQRGEFVLEQRQPMLHPRQAPPVADRLIERIAGRGRAEAFAVARAEAFDAVLVDQRFGSRQQHEAVDAPGGALIGGVEGADAFDFVAEEIEPERVFLAAREQVDQAAAHGKFTCIGNGFDADIAIGLQECGEPVAPDPLLGRKPRDQLADAKRRQRALRHRIDGGEQQLRALGRLLQAVERRHALCHDAQRR